MECPQCKLVQPDGNACVQCHTPLGEFASEYDRVIGDGDMGSSPGGGLGGISLDDVLPEGGLGGITEVTIAVDEPAPPQAAAPPAATPTPKPSDPPKAPAPKSTPTPKLSDPPKTPANAPGPPRVFPQAPPGAPPVILVTAQDVPGKQIKSVQGMVSGKALVQVGAEMVSKLTANPAAPPAGAAMDQAVKTAEIGLISAAVVKGANAVVGITRDWKPAADGNLLLTLSGTAVTTA